MAGAASYSRLARMADTRGIKCKFIASTTGVSTWQLSRIAKGSAAEPWPGFFERVAGMLNCSPDDIRPEVPLKVAA